MPIDLRPLRRDDAEAHCAGEDEVTVRWLTGGISTIEATRAHFDRLAANAAAACGKRGFGVWLDERLAGYVDFDTDNEDGLEPGEVNISYAVHPWARGRGVAVDAVGLICTQIRKEAAGTRAVIRVEPENTASVRVAEKSGFRFVSRYVSTTDLNDDGSPVTLALYVRDL